MIERAMTVREVAEYFNVDQKAIYRLLSTDALDGLMAAGTWRFKRSDIDSWIDAQKQHSLNAGREPGVTGGAGAMTSVRETAPLDLPRSEKAAG